MGKGRRHKGMEEADGRTDRCLDGRDGMNGGMYWVDGRDRSRSGWTKLIERCAEKLVEGRTEWMDGLDCCTAGWIGLGVLSDRVEG